MEQGKNGDISAKNGEASANNIGALQRVNKAAKGTNYMDQGREEAIGIKI